MFRDIALRLLLLFAKQGNKEYLMVPRGLLFHSKCHPGPEMLIFLVLSALFPFFLSEQIDKM